MASKATVKRELRLKDHRGSWFSIRCQAATKPNPSLGFLLCPTGDKTFEFKKRLKGSKQVCKVIVNNVFNDGGTGSGSEKVCKHVSSYFSREGSFFELLEDNSQNLTPGP